MLCNKHAILPQITNSQELREVNSWRIHWAVSIHRGQGNGIKSTAVQGLFIGRKIDQPGLKGTWGKANNPFNFILANRYTNEPIVKSGLKT